MNKKLIAIAVATVMAAPVAMADVKMSGRINQQFTQLSTDRVAPAADTSVLDYSDNGHTRLQFDITAGDAFGRMATDFRENNIGNDRERYIGYKFGSSSIQFGRMAGAAKNVEKDPLIATFLEVRSTVASSAAALTGRGSAYDSNGFVSDMAQFATKVNGVAIKVQMGLSDNDAAAAGVAGATNQGYVGISATGKAGPARWFFSHNNDAADGTAAGSTNDDSNMKLGASMKFGKVNATLAYKTSEDGDAAGGSLESTAIVVRANMGFGNGLKGYFGYATTNFEQGGGDADATWLRLAVAKKLNKSTTFYGGYTSTEYDAALAAGFGRNDTSEIGVGMTIKF